METISVYLVRNKSGAYLWFDPRSFLTTQWTGIKYAKVFHYKEVAREAGVAAYHWDDDANEQFDVIEFYLVQRKKDD